MFSKAYGNDVAAMSHAANIWEFIGLKKLFLKEVIPKGQITSKSAFLLDENGIEPD